MVVPLDTLSLPELLDEPLEFHDWLLELSESESEPEAAPAVARVGVVADDDLLGLAHHLLLADAPDRVDQRVDRRARCLARHR